MLFNTIDIDLSVFPALVKLLIVKINQKFIYLKISDFKKHIRNQLKNVFPISKFWKINIKLPIFTNKTSIIVFIKIQVQFGLLYLLVLLRNKSNLK